VTEAQAWWIVAEVGVVALVALIGFIRGRA
jgi:hypothetical protein